MIQHHIESLVKVKNLTEILIIGSYNAQELVNFVQEMINTHGISIRYLQEFTALGTAGGMYHFRDQIRAGSPEGFFIINGDVCADFPLEKMIDDFKETDASLTVLTTEATRLQSLNYGCLVLGKNNSIIHYVEKPSTFVSTIINCGIYLASVDIFQIMSDVFYSHQDKFM